jgi:hypothetical protein
MTNRKMVLPLLALGLAGAGATVSADDYRAEVRLLGDRAEPEGNAPHFDRFTALGT